MSGVLARNILVGFALLAGVQILVVLETRFMFYEPHGAWFFSMAAIAFGGFIWANARSFHRLDQPFRALAVSALASLLWLITVFLVVTLGINLKFALGGHL